jgi:general secretion pathway protein D
VNPEFSTITGFMTNFMAAGTNGIIPSSVTPIRQSLSVANNFGLPLPLTGATGNGGLYQILGSDFSATLQAIAQAGRSELLSRPSILARDGQPAEVAVGQEVPLITGVTYTTSGNTTIPILTPTYTKVGIILDVTPFISANNTVEMILAPQISSVDPTLTQTIAQGVSAPYLDVRSANTVAVTPNGEPVVIGGLMENDKASAESKIPFLGDIPFLGNFFKAKSKSDEKSELLIFVTPHIVQAPEQLAALSNSEMNRSGAITNSIDERELDLFLDRLPVKKSR